MGYCFETTIVVSPFQNQFQLQKGLFFTQMFFKVQLPIYLPYPLLSIHLLFSHYYSGVSCSYSPDKVDMTVRRYSMNSSPPGVTRNERVVDPWMRHFGWARVQEEILGGNGNRDRSVTSDVASASDGTSLQEYVHKTR